MQPENFSRFIFLHGNLNTYPCTVKTGLFAKSPAQCCKFEIKTHCPTYACTSCTSMPWGGLERGQSRRAEARQRSQRNPWASNGVIRVQVSVISYHTGLPVGARQRSDQISGISNQLPHRVTRRGEACLARQKNPISPSKKIPPG